MTPKCIPANECSIEVEERQLSEVTFSQNLMVSAVGMVRSAMCHAD